MRKNLTKVMPALAGALCAVHVSTAVAGAAPATTVWFRQPAAGFDQSLVLGNGRIGAMVYGGVEREKIVLNESSVWSGSHVDNDIPGAYKHLPEIRRLLAEEKLIEAGRLTKKHFAPREKPVMGKGIGTFGRYQNLGSLHLTFSGGKGDVREYQRDLDLETALGTIAYKRGETSFSREHFVSAPDQVFVSRLTGPVSFSVAMDRPERFETTAVGDRELLMTGTLNDGKGGDGLTYAARLRVVGGSVNTEGNKLVVRTDDEVLLLFAAATDYRGMAGRQLSDPIAATNDDLNKAAKRPYAKLREAQKADHEKWFNRVSLKLPETKNSRLPTDQRLVGYRAGKADPSLAALFANMGRYLLIGSSRPGGLPANLQGIWAEELHTMWNGDWHFNINVQMNYWPALVCNLVELHEPMVSLIESLVEPGSKTARVYYDSPGWIAHRATNPWGFTSPGMMDLGSAAWLCEHLWEQYAFTLDREFLREVYPVLKGSSEFFLHNLWEEPDHKWLVTGPSKSSETGGVLPNGQRAGICYGPTMDMQALRQLFGNTARAAEILGVDEELQRELLVKRARLAPNQIGPDGRIQEWIKPYEDSEPTHRHVSPLYGLCPYYEITPEATPELAEASRKFLEKRGVGQSTGWSNAWKVNLWARLGDAQKSWGFVRQMLLDNCYDNLLSQFRPLKNGKGRKLFMIEANFGLTSGIAEMLMQSQPESGKIGAPPVIRLLPALPEAWPEGKVTGLLARGGFEVDVEWKDGRLAEASIRSLYGNPCRVRYGTDAKEMELKAGESRTFSGAAFDNQVKVQPPRGLGATRASRTAPAAPGTLEQFITGSGFPGGVIVHVNATDITQTVKAAKTRSFHVHGLYTNDALLNKTRAAILTGGLGGKVTVSYHHGRRLPFVDNSVNLFIVEPGPRFDPEEVMRVLVPRGLALCEGKTLTKPVRATIDDWTHNLYDAGNNAVSRDLEAGSPRHLQWTADPQYCRSHDANNSFQAMVSCAGRIFYLMDEGSAAFLSLPSKWFLTARDGFNGKVLWKKKLPQPLVVHLDHLKSGMGNLAHRLVAAEDRVYVTLGFNAPVSALDSRTGREAWVSKASANAEELILYKGTLYCIVNLDERSLSKHDFMSMRSWNLLRANEIPRKVLALDAATGKPLWKHQPEKTILPMSMTVAGDSLYLHDGTAIVALDRNSGKQRWVSEPVDYWKEMGLHSGVSLVHYDGVLLFASTQDHRSYKSGQGGNTMLGLDAKSGKILWKGAQRQFTQYFSAVDLMVADGLVWSAPLFNAVSSGKYMGVDPKTGKVVRDFDPDPGVAMAHHRCHRNRGTERYLFTGRTGVDVFDVKSGRWMHDYWARGTCRYGMMPANGMLYVPPNSCACYSGTLIRGFNAMTADTPSRRLPARIPDKRRLVRGPAFGSPKHQSPITDHQPRDWPTFRSSASRHGMASSALDTSYVPAWKGALGGRLTQPVIAGGKVVVSSIDAHTVYALDEPSGKVAWRFLAGGRVNSPPTLWQGRVLFGCNDGRVYCLDLGTGELGWTFRAAPAERWLMARGTLESAWPLNGSVLLLPDKASGRTRLYCVAGRSVFLDGGLRMLVLDAGTGEKLSESVMDRTDPETGEYLLDGHEWPPDSPTTIPDVLSLVNGKVYMGQQPFGLDGKREAIHYPSRREYEAFASRKATRKQDTSRDHLFATTGLLDDQQWHRGVWYFGRDALGSCWSVNLPAFASPSGYLLALDDKNVYGYGREFFVEGTRHTTHLFKCDKYPELAPASRLEEKKIELRRKNWGTTPRWDWSEKVDVYVRAMLVAPSIDSGRPNLLFAAGAPDVLDEYDAMTRIQRAQRDWSQVGPIYKKEKAVAGELGAKLIVVSTGDGKRLFETPLDSPPVFDGMSAANGKLFISDMAGNVICLAPGHPNTAKGP